MQKPSALGSSKQLQTVKEQNSPIPNSESLIGFRQSQFASVVSADKPQRKASPPLFKYKAKYVAKHFDPFKELEQQREQEAAAAGQMNEFQLEVEQEENPEQQIALSFLHKKRKISFVADKRRIVSQQFGCFIQHKKTKKMESSMNDSHKFKKLENTLRDSEQLNEFQLPIENNNPSKVSLPNDSKVTLQNDSKATIDKYQQQQQKQQGKSRPATAAATITSKQFIPRDENGQPIQNIFETVKVYETYQKAHIGPQYDAEGNIKQYTLVGKPEWYAKQSKQSFYQLPQDIEETTVQQKKIKNQQQLKDLGSLQAIPRLLSANQIGLSRSHVSLGNKVKAKDENFLVQEIQIQEVKQCIQSVQDRIERNNLQVQKINAQQLHHLGEGDRLQVTKESRVLEKFQKKEQKILYEIKKQCKKINKNYQDSCLLRDSAARTKAEAREMLELVAPNVQTHGSEYFWAYGLRKTNDDRDELVETVLNKDKKHKQMREIGEKRLNEWDSLKPVHVLEQIRKPISSLTRTAMQNELPFNSFNSKEVLRQRIHENQHYFDQLAILDNPSIETLEIVGKNVLNSETKALMNAPNNTRFVLKIPNTAAAQNRNNVQEGDKEQQQQQQQQQNQDRAKQANNIHNINAPHKNLHDTKKIGSALPSSRGITNRMRSAQRLDPVEPALVQFIGQQQTQQPGKMQSDQQLEGTEEIIEEKYVIKELYRAGAYNPQLLKLQY